MNLTIKPFFFLIIFLCFYNCSSNRTKNKELPNNVTKIRQPEFLDNGRTVDSLKRVYNCESIEYENWEDDDATDSSLTICLVNSNRVPSSNINDTYSQFKEIASQIKQSLAKPESYKSYYIIFVKIDTVNGIVSKSHTAGSDIPSTNL